MRLAPLIARDSDVAPIQELANNILAFVEGELDLLHEDIIISPAPRKGLIFFMGIKRTIFVRR